MENLKRLIADELLQNGEIKTVVEAVAALPWHQRNLFIVMLGRKVCLDCAEPKKECECCTPLPTIRKPA
jgi:hypothetical protein